MAVSLSDYTLGVGQGWWIDEILQGAPRICAARCWQSQTAGCRGRSGRACGSCPRSHLALVAIAGWKAARSSPGSRRRPARHDRQRRQLRWQRARRATGGSPWCAQPRRVRPIDPLNPQSGPEVIEAVLPAVRGPLSRRRRARAELLLLRRTGLRRPRQPLDARGSPRSSASARATTCVPELPALFVDIGPRTPKVRLDYRDVMVALSEEGSTSGRSSTGTSSAA